ADFAGADGHAEAANRLAERHERPLVEVFTRWYGALRTAAGGARGRRGRRSRSRGGWTIRPCWASR
ncbi:hypothetical protein, partial [Actinomadura sp. WAC 06369]|uniref:hypothetical protein n=1 Tax=Actinomadura sp. WAC 06369 TaxID=2203193 RepID=UPI001000AD68